jgi:hypothetical protein
VDLKNERSNARPVTACKRLPSPLIRFIPMLSDGWLASCGRRDEQVADETGPPASFQNDQRPLAGHFQLPLLNERWPTAG